MSRLPVRVKALFIAPCSPGTADGSVTGKPGGRTHGSSRSTLTSPCISEGTEWLRVLLALSGRSCSPCRHTGETPRRHGRPTARGSVHPPGVGEQQRLGSWWAYLDNPLEILGQASMWPPVIGHPGTVSHCEGAGQQRRAHGVPSLMLPQQRTSGKAWGRVAASGMRPSRTSTCSSCFLPNIPCSNGKGEGGC